MNREDIIRMAREAGGVFIDPPCGDCYTFDIDDGTLELFAALVAAAEREACQKECDELAGILFCHGDKDGAEIAVSLRDAIRARSNHD